MTMIEERRELIPVVDVGPYLHGEPGALADTAAQVGAALEGVGFYFVVGHGIDWCLVEQMFAEATRLHALPDEVKTALAFSPNTGGFLKLGGGTSYASDIAGEVRKPNLNAAFFAYRERPAVDPGVEADTRFRAARNQWPAETDLPGFKRTVLTYCRSLEDLGLRLLPLYAVALDLPAHHFDDAFVEAQYTLRMSHYPVVEHEAQQWGLAPHTDSGFMTLLPDNQVPGLEIRPAGHDWVRPPALAHSFLVNSGDILRRWTNGRFLSTAHRVLNGSGRDRYAVPFFFDPRIDVAIEALPTCTGPGNPPRWEPTTYGEYLTWFMNRNYARQTGQSTDQQAP